MQDEPSGRLLIEQVRLALKAGIPMGFQQRVAANAIDVAIREMDLASTGHAAEKERLARLLAARGALENLNQALAAAIRAGEMDTTDQALTRHLILTTVEKMIVDQPGYPAFRAWQNEGRSQ